MVPILRRPLTSVVLLAALTLTAGSIAAQNSQDAAAGHDMRRPVDVFSGVLRESLDLNQRQGIFSPRNGDVTGRYLQGQGVVLQVTTPLQRGGWPETSMDTLSQSLSELGEQLGVMLERGVVERPDFEAVRDAMALSLRTDEVAQFYRERLQALSSFELEPAIQRSLSEAATVVQQLQQAELLDADAVLAIASELSSLRAELNTQLDRAMQLRDAVREEAVQAQALPDDATLERWQSMREEIEQQMLALAERSQQQMAELRQRQQALRDQQQQQWQRDLAAFEQRLFGTVCDYAAGLRQLPSGEHLSLVLVGTGQQLDSGERLDRIHVIDQQDLQRCQQGELTGEALAQRALTYDY